MRATKPQKANETTAPRRRWAGETSLADSIAEEFAACATVAAWQRAQGQDDVDDDCDEG